MHDPRTTICALNNADWCRLICGAHGIESVQHSTHWECLGRPPRYYPSAVTLGPSRETPENLRIGSPEFLGIKDSFCCLDMAPYGMHVVLKAEWIWRDAGPAPASGLTWAMVQNDDELLAWEAAWAKDDEDAKNHPRQFPASLLNDPECRFIQVCAGDQLVGGGALNLASRVVGLSNLFADPGMEVSVWSALLEAAESEFPGRSQVGYEGGGALKVAAELGFEPIGKLRVWGV